MREVCVASIVPPSRPTATCGRDSASQWHRILTEVERCWPRNTAKKLSTVTGGGVRTAYRWLARKAKPSSTRTLAILAELKREHEERGKWLEQFELDLH